MSSIRNSHDNCDSRVSTRHELPVHGRVQSDGEDAEDTGEVGEAGPVGGEALDQLVDRGLGHPVAHHPRGPGHGGLGAGEDKEAAGDEELGRQGAGDGGAPYGLFPHEVSILDPVRVRGLAPGPSSGHIDHSLDFFTLYTLYLIDSSGRHL